MTNPAQHSTSALRNSVRTLPFALALMLALTIAAMPAQAQTYSVLHNFTRGPDGASPEAGLTMDKAGNLYGTANSGGAGYGTVFKLAHKGSGWTFSPLYSFAGGSDGGGPAARVIFGPNGTLYGSTTFGGQANNGTVYNLRPPASACKAALCPWAETVLYPFKGGSDGSRPSGDLLFDQAGNIFGTTSYGGDSESDGTVYELMPFDGGWTESILYRFTDGNDGAEPNAGVIFDKAGNLYGTAGVGGANGFGTVFQLTLSGSGWGENTLYSFQNGSDGGIPNAGLIFDASGNLYGDTSSGGVGFGGTVFELTPSGGNWMFAVLYSFSGSGGPFAGLVMDAAGNLYGTTSNDGAHGQGCVFKLTPSGAGWTYTDLYDFTGGSDGGRPFSNVIFDANGNLYGTTFGGGSQGAGVVWEIAP